MADRPSTMPRRAALAVLGGAATLALGARVTSAQQKMTKAQAQYQDTPKGIMMCGTCTLFLPPAGCKVVEGDVAVTGWCNAFDLAD